VKNVPKSSGGKKKNNGNGNGKGQEFASEIKNSNNDYIGKGKRKK
jgi:hypothetical protein